MLLSNSVVDFFFPNSKAIRHTNHEMIEGERMGIDLFEWFSRKILCSDVSVPFIVIPIT